MKYCPFERLSAYEALNSAFLTTGDLTTEDVQIMIIERDDENEQNQIGDQRGIGNTNSIQRDALSFNNIDETGDANIFTNLGFSDNEEFSTEIIPETNRINDIINADDDESPIENSKDIFTIL